MINKKLLAIVSIATTIVASSAFAKTEGHYVGVNVVNSSVDHQHDNGSAQFSEKKVGYGVDYKYAMGLTDTLFVAPGVFAEANNLNALDTSTGDIVKNDYRYGVKLDIGHDLTDDVAIYFTNGLSANHYDSKRVSVGNKSGTELGYFYGAGFSLNVAKDLALNIEYNTQKVRFDTANTVDLDSDLSVFKVGAIYHF